MSEETKEEEKNRLWRELYPIRHNIYRKQGKILTGFDDFSPYAAELSKELLKENKEELKTIDEKHDKLIKARRGFYLALSPEEKQEALGYISREHGQLYRPARNLWEEYRPLDKWEKRSGDVIDYVDSPRAFKVHGEKRIFPEYGHTDERGYHYGDFYLEEQANELRDIHKANLEYAEGLGILSEKTKKYMKKKRKSNK